MAGLDPAIHLLERILRRVMDAWVKPAHDASCNWLCVLVSDSLFTNSKFRFSIGQELFYINESLTLDSAKKTDSNRHDSEAVGVLPQGVARRQF
jgi:hypothetical protein